MINEFIFVAYFISLYFLIFWILGLFESSSSSPKKLSSFPLVSICIPAYNESKNIIESIESALGLDYPKKNLQILVVNDGSSDSTKEVVERYLSQHPEHPVTLINQRNKGKGAAMNAGLKAATGEYYISLDADSMVSPDALSVILPHFSQDHIAAVLPMIRVQDPKTIMHKIQHCEYLINFFLKKLFSNLNCIHVAPGPFAVYRKDVLVKLGGFDEDNLVEDLEMAVRLQKHHYHIIQVLNTTIMTKAPSSFKQFYKQRNRWYKGSLLNIFKYRKMMFNKEYGDFGVFQFPMVFVSAVLSITLFLIFVFWLTLRPLILKLHDLSYINFDFMPLVTKGFDTFTFLNFNFKPLFFGLVVIIAVFGVAVLSYHAAGEHIRKDKKSVVLYLFVYPLMMAVIWLGVLFDLIRGKIQKW